MLINLSLLYISWAQNFLTDPRICNANFLFYLTLKLITISAYTLLAFVLCEHVTSMLY